MAKISTETKRIFDIIEKSGQTRSSEIVRMTGLSTKTVYKHLGTLLDNDQLQKTGTTPRVFYSVKSSLKSESFRDDNLRLQKLFAKESARMVDKIKIEYQPEKIFIFGSFAANKIAKDSDIDFFIIKKTTKVRRERNREVSRLLLDRQVPVDILVYTPEEVNRRKKLGDTFILDIINNGQLVYDKK